MRQGSHSFEQRLRVIFQLFESWSFNNIQLYKNFNRSKQISDQLLEQSKLCLTARCVRYDKKIQNWSQLAYYLSFGQTFLFLSINVIKCPFHTSYLSSFSNFQRSHCTQNFLVSHLLYEFLNSCVNFLLYTDVDVLGDFKQAFYIMNQFLLNWLRSQQLLFSLKLLQHLTVSWNVIIF